MTPRKPRLLSLEQLESRETPSTVSLFIVPSAPTTAGLLKAAPAKLATSTTLTLSDYAPVAGQSITLTASVTTVLPGQAVPRGKVVFQDGTRVLGTAPLNAQGIAQISYTFTSVKVCNLRASFVANAAWLGSTASLLPITVQPNNVSLATPSSAGTLRDQSGETIRAEVRVSEAIATFVILGTNRADSILVSQQDNRLILKTPAGQQTFSAPNDSPWGGILIYGFDGNDSIRLDASVSSSLTVTLHGGEGNDNLINNSPAQATIFLGTGNSTVVTVGAGLSTIYDGPGLNSFWINTRDRLVNLGAEEVAARAVHRIAAFTSPKPGVVVPLTIAGQTMVQPTARYAYSNLFANRPLFVGVPQYNDIRQGALGDCYFLAGLSSLAQKDPVFLQQAIVALGDGTYAVRFFRSDGSEAYFRIDAQLPTYGNRPAYANLARNGQALWVPLLEKAFAQFRRGTNSYSSIEGGWMSEAYRAIANASTSWVYTTSTANTLAQNIANYLASGKAVTAGSYSYPPSPIVGGHAYQVLSSSYDTVKKTWYVTVYNPWGVDGRSFDSNSSDGLLRLTAAQFKACFYALNICNA
jgi:hypothetical protein